MTLAELDPLAAGSYQSSGNDADQQAANPTPVAQTWSRSKRGVVVGVVVAFCMLLALGFAVLNTSPSSELLDMSLLEDSSSSSPFVNFHTCGKTKTVVVKDEADIPFVFGEGVYEITILDFPGAPTSDQNTISLTHYPETASRFKSFSEVEISGDGFHPSIFLQVDDGSDYLRVTPDSHPASLKISLVCDGNYGHPVPPSRVPIRGRRFPEILRAFPYHKFEMVGIVNYVRPGTEVTAGLGLNRDRNVRVRTFVEDSPMTGIGMQDDKDMRDPSGRILAYTWQSNVDITVDTYVTEY